MAMAQPQAMTPVRPKQAFRFLNLPMEIRAMILSKLLIPENIIYDCDYDESGNRSTIRQSANVGCISINTLDPEEYDALSTKRTSFLVTGHKSYCEWQSTTYGSGRSSSIDLRVLRTNRQIYQEASVIFYGRNMFFADNPSVVIPFLKDRSSRSLRLIRKLSIIYPSHVDLVDTVNAENGYFGSPSHNTSRCDESMWEDVCCYISLHMPGLVHLDLRVNRESGFEGGPIQLLEHESFESLQTSSDFPTKRRKDLATLGPETVLTVSETDWPDWEELLPLRPGSAPDPSDNDESYWEDPTDVLFSPLQPWLSRKISRLRKRNGLAPGTTPSDRQEVVQKFWATRRKRGNHRFYRLPCPEEDEIVDTLAGRYMPMPSTRLRIEEVAPGEPDDWDGDESDDGRDESQLVRRL